MISGGRATNWQIEVFHDGDCPLCSKEIAMLQKMDRQGRIRFTDIADPSFRAEDYGISYQQFMDQIQGRLPDGRWIEGVEVFRRLYSAVGFRWLVWPTRLPGVSHLLDWGYDRFSKNRLRWTGRCTGDSCDVRTPSRPPSSSQL